ncbi:MAG: photosynthetic reaction center subunit H [Pseudomonadota bacterium]
MNIGNIAGNIDFAQICLYIFWLFFICLIFYLRQEDRREGYPLIAEPEGQKPRGFFFIPDPKTFHLPHGGTKQAPDFELEKREMKIEKREVWPGAPFVPTGDPMADGVGPASWAERSDTPDLTAEGEPKIVPLREAKDYEPAPGEADPRGMVVIAGDRAEVGTVSDLWVDKAEHLIRYLEVSLSDNDRKVLVPMTMAGLVKPIGKADGRVHVNSIYGAHFANVPKTARATQVTLLEEEKIMAYFAGGTLYADPKRQEPLL